MIKIGLIGCGGIAQLHADAIQALSGRCSLKAIFDENDKQAERFADGLPHLHVAKTFTEFLEQPLDAVIIGVPNRFHAQYVRAAAERGLAVLCEKPASDTLEGAYHMQEAVQNAGVVNLIGFENRYRGGVQRLHKFITSQALGKVFAYREICTGARLVNEDIGMEWRMRDSVSGAGAVTDFGSHSMDMATWMLEPVCGPLVQVYGSLGTFVPHDGTLPNNDDMSVLTGRFASGALLSIFNSRVGPGTYRVEIMGANGYAAYDASEPDALTIQWYSEDHPEFEANEDIDKRSPFLIQLDTFLTAIETGQSAQPDFQTAYKVQRLLETAIKSPM
ncbi:Gfo/Idh/MocA family protein [Alicyclobacillus sp. SO9]|uniref:Gfo/Idh/MocA family protein n=1 Tax=Alicyclobacillus sp. SO9 TaxID=2665646 RepID=UPI0018E75838|nr:Gfo/Idh/MocA family oxidoreductase [Alicyclobacillus sp. SO9]QQE80534.1 Gfo/Idh/MocA family oxidoreductase [Alicyclobacillus sp. SO9]